MNTRLIHLFTWSLLLAVAVPAFAADGLVAPLSAAGGSAVGSLGRVVLLAALFCCTVAAFKIPGTGLPEIACAVLVAALLVPLALAGDAQWYEVVAILVGVGLVAVEVFVIPGFGFTGVVGALLLVGGLIMSFVPDPRVVALSLVDVREAMLVLIGGAVGGFAGIALLGRYLPQLPRAHRLVLPDSAARPLEHEVIRPGDVGTTLTVLRPMGTAEFGTVEVQVIAQSGVIAAGTRVHVLDYHDGIATVIPFAPASASAPRVTPSTSFTPHASPEGNLS